jgi:hypothetical protein
MDRFATNSAYPFPIRRPWATYSLILLIPFALVAYDACSDSLDGPRYIIPLAGGYILHTSGEWDASPSDLAAYGPYQIIKLPLGTEFDSDPVPVSFLSLGSTDSADCIRHIEEIEVAGDDIFGKTSSGYFLLETAGQHLAFYRSSNELSAARSSAHISAGPLRTPEAIAAGLDKRVKHPWAFVQMEGLFGLSDEAWSGIVVDYAFMFALVAGWIIPRGRDAVWLLIRKLSLLAFGLVLGFFTAGFAYGTLLDSGPITLVGLFLLMPFFAVVALLSEELAALVDMLIGRLIPDGKMP